MSSPLAPGPVRHLPFAQSFEFRRDPLGFLERAAAGYGDLVSYRLLGRPATLLVNPVHIEQVLVREQRRFTKSVVHRRLKIVLGDGLLTSEGSLHLRQRRLAQPAFHRDRIAAYAERMVAATRRAADRWIAAGAVDLSESMTRLTLAIVSDALFAVDLEGEAGEVAHIMSSARDLFADRIRSPVGPLLNRLPLPSTVRMRAEGTRLDRTIHRIISERRGDGVDRGDLLSMLMLARDEETGEAMSDVQLRDEVMTIFLAGHETTATALTWCWFLLARHPAVLERMRHEIDTVLTDRPPTASDVARLPYVGAVFTETLRLYPPAWIFGREPREDVEVGGFRLPRGSIVHLSPWVTQRDPRFFDDPLAFRPERWTPNFRESLPKFAYFPFGGGARKCIGDGFARMEGVLLLATIAQRCDIHLAVDPERIRPLPQITLRPGGGLPVRVTERAGPMV